MVEIIEILLSLVESFIELKYFHDVATSALLCHKEPARRIQSFLLGSLERSLVLYGIRIVGFHALKGPIIGANENVGYIS